MTRQANGTDGKPMLADEGEAVKAISIWQPHGSLLLLGPTRYETRWRAVPRSLLAKRVALAADFFGK